MQESLPLQCDKKCKHFRECSSQALYEYKRLKTKNTKEIQGKKMLFIHTAICTIYCTLLHLQDLSCRILNPL